jgi:putative oxygen-independent coproporphyrinogen III oxidase
MCEPHAVTATSIPLAPIEPPWSAAAPDALATVPFGLYVHVPFCARRCGYCAFTTETLVDPSSPAAADRVESYVAAAVAEIRTSAAAIGSMVPPLTSVFVGGGTPTMLAPSDLGRILDAATSSFDPGADLEVTVESNPDGLARGQLAAMAELGVTRVSFGMQSVRRSVLAVLDRTHDPQRALDAVGEALDAGIRHVSLDLIYGTPGETDEDWVATLDAVLDTGVDHVSAYALGIESGTRLAARVRSGELPRPDDDEAADRYLVADERLSAVGFEWYEISNWARGPSARCRHNQLYWRNHHWWGVGPGAHSHLAGTRWWNRRDTTRWAAGVHDGHGGQVEGHEHLDTEQRRLEDLMLGIRLSDGLALPDGRRLVLTPRGRLLADTVVRRLVAAEDAGAQKSVAPSS